MKSIWAVFLCLLVLAGRAADLKPEEIHPKVFQLLDGWLADSAAPVVTEVNLDAVRRNRNQFDFAKVNRAGEWVVYTDGAETLRFKVLKTVNSHYTVLFQENGGGSLTTERTIQFLLVPRTIALEGKETTVTVLRVVSFGFSRR